MGGHKVSIYASTPVNALLGEARIRRVVPDNPEQIWDTYNSRIGSSKEEFNEYSGLSSEVYAIELDDVRPYRSGVPISQIYAFLDIDTELRPPQSYMSLNKNESWAQAVSIASLLHGRFKNTLTII